MSGERRTGIVKWFNDTKGFGYIDGEGAPDVFVHVQNITASGLKTLGEGQKVSFTVFNGPNGEEAREVQAVQALM